MNNIVNLKLKELRNVINQRNDLQSKKDLALENEINFLKHQLKVQEKQIKEQEIEIQLLSDEVERKENEIMKIYDTLLQRDRDLMELTEELSVKEERLMLANHESKLKSQRIENLRLEMAEYLDKLSKTKKALKHEKVATLHSESLYNMLKDIYSKKSKQIEFERKEFIERISAAHDYVSDLHELLKKNGVELGLDSSQENEPEKERETFDWNSESSSEAESSGSEIMSVQSKVLNWKPSKSMTTIYEEDEESCENADDEGFSGTKTSDALKSTSDSDYDTGMATDSSKIVESNDHVIENTEADENNSESIEVISENAQEPCESKDVKETKSAKKLKHSPTFERIRRKRRYSTMMTMGSF